MIILMIHSGRYLQCTAVTRENSECDSVSAIPKQEAIVDKAKKIFVQMVR